MFRLIPRDNITELLLILKFLLEDCKDLITCIGATGLNKHFAVINIVVPKLIMSNFVDRSDNLEIR